MDDRPCPPPGPVDYRKLRLAAEAGIRAMLPDPGSAQFQWPFGFAYGNWKPTLYSHQSGFLGCGVAAGRWFSVILRDDKVVLAHLDQAGGYPQSQRYCASLGLPGPQPGMLDAAPQPGQTTGLPSSVAGAIASAG
jgi:hypothetical protein